MNSDARRALELAAISAIGAAGLLHLGRPVRLRSRLAVSAVTLAPASLLPAAAAEIGLIAGRRWAAAAFGGIVLAGCAAPHVSAHRRRPRSALRHRRAESS